MSQHPPALRSASPRPPAGGADLFTAAPPPRAAQPLAERLRPERLDEVVGQQALLGPEGTLLPLLARGSLPSLILWGPPGSGKTSIARLLAAAIGADVEALSAVHSGVKDLRGAVERAARHAGMTQRRTLLFIDEIHRFNRTQQDALLPHVERGTVTLVGATTENPSFEINPALLSRCQVLVLAPIDDDAMLALPRRALADATRGLGALSLQTEPAALAAIVAAAGGDARRALSCLELAAAHASAATGGQLSVTAVARAAQQPAQHYDRSGPGHQDVTSAFIKSMRGGDPDAALYYLARMLAGGEPPRFILRRRVIFASEDIGLADPQALPLAVAALQAYELVGLPEGTLAITHAAAYLACAAKSNAILRARDAAVQAAATHGALPVPLPLRAPGGGVGRARGFGQGYTYPPQAAAGSAPVTYLPPQLAGTQYLTLGSAGDEPKTAARLTARQARQR